MPDTLLSPQTPAPLRERTGVPRWRVELLDPPAILTPGGLHPPHLLERKDAALFALLALGGPLPRARVVALLWPAVPESGGRRNLRQRLFRLRRSFGADLIAGDQLLGLAPGVSVALLTAAQDLAQDPEACSGELLGRHAYDDLPAAAAWIERERRRWRQRLAELLVTAATRCLEEGRAGQGLAYARRLQAEWPGHPEGLRLTMRLLAHAGDRQGALAAFAAARHRLAEAGSGPDPATVEFARRIEAELARGAPSVQPPPAWRVPLVGRAAAWAALERAWIDRRPALVEGPPGAGRSRLLEEFAAAQPGTVLVGLHEGDRYVPGRAFERVAAALPAATSLPAATAGAAATSPAAPAAGPAPPADPAQPSPQAPGLAPGRVGPCELVALLREAAGGGLAAIAIDDVDRVDLASARRLAEVAGAVPALRWVLAGRTGACPAALLDGLARVAGGVAHIALAPLDADALAQLQRSAGLARPDGDRPDADRPDRGRYDGDPSRGGRLAAATGGNALYVVELLRHWSAAGPGEPAQPVPPLEALLGRRLEALSEPARRLAGVLALSAAPLDLGLAAAVLQLGAAALAAARDELGQAGLLVRGALAGAAWRAAVLRSLADAPGVVLRRVVAGELLARGEAPATAALLLEEWGELRQAGAAWRLAGGVARGRGDPGLAAELLDRARSALARAGAGDETFAVGVERVRLLLAGGASDTAAAAIEALRGVSSSAQQRAELLLLDARTQLARERARTAAEAAGAAERYAEILADDPLRLEAALVQVQALVADGEAAAAAVVLERAQRGADGDPRHAFTLAELRARVLQGSGRLRDALAELDRAQRLAESDGDRGRALELHLRRAELLYQLGGAAEAAEVAATVATGVAAAVAAPASAPDATLAFRAGLAQGRYRAAAGAPQDALRHLEALAARYRQGEPERDQAGIEVAALLARLGQAQRARARLNALVVDPAVLPACVRLRRLRVLGRLERLAQRPALALLEPAADTGPGRACAPERLAAIGDRSAERAAGPAAAELRAARDEAHGLGLAALVAVLELRLAEALLRGGAAEEAAPVVERALAAARTLRHEELDLPEVLLVAHLVAERLGRPLAAGDARALLREAVQAVRARAAVLPPQFADGFLHRHPVNRQVLTRATRWLAPDPGPDPGAGA